MSTALFAGGCFWCMEPAFDQLEGVTHTEVGFTGGHLEFPTYEQVVRGGTGHVEAIRVHYDPKKVSYDTLVSTFWTTIDPTTENQQFADKGTHYQTVIFYSNEEEEAIANASKEELSKSGKFDKPIVTQLRSAGPFYMAEDYHQDYYLKNPLRYQQYKKGSGREDYLKETWPQQND